MPSGQIIPRGIISGDPTLFISAGCTSGCRSARPGSSTRARRPGSRPGCLRRLRRLDARRFEPMPWGKGYDAFRAAFPRRRPGVRPRDRRTRRERPRHSQATRGLLPAAHDRNAPGRASACRASRAIQPNRKPLPPRSSMPRHRSIRRLPPYSSYSAPIASEKPRASTRNPLPRRKERVAHEY